ncbi:hypothetical protein [Sorangium sp. So ce1099]|uniref:hypothetical protein n=1 Tax=Sorangium sp. So ce1099 TaxID=3133331 RepID=UPI003F5DEBBA
MRICIVALLAFVTGCAGQSKTAQQRLAEVKAYRRAQEIERQEIERKEKAGPPPAGAPAAPAPGAAPAGQGAPSTLGAPAGQPGVPAAATGQPGAPAAATGQPGAPAAATGQPGAPAAATGQPGAPATRSSGAADDQASRGPRAGRVGLGVTLGGATAAAGQLLPMSSTLALRGFVSDSVSLAGVAGIGIGASGSATDVSLGVGAEVVVFLGDLGENVYPFFVGETAYHWRSVTGSGDGEPIDAGADGSTVAFSSVAAGGGLEYWVAPRLSVNARLMVGAVIRDGGAFFETFRPGLGVTLFAN